MTEPTIDQERLDVFLLAIDCEYRDAEYECRFTEYEYEEIRSEALTTIQLTNGSGVPTARSGTKPVPCESADRYQRRPVTPNCVPADRCWR